MLQAYTMFPGRGFNVKPLFITRIEDRNGNVLQSFTPERRDVISEMAAYNMIKMMQGVIDRGTGRGLRSYVEGDVAGKTGTTNDNSDAWFIGYTPQLLAGSWVGCDDRFIRFASNEGQGSRAALPIWGYFYEKASNDPNCGLDTRSTFAKPENMAVDPDMGWTPAADLPATDVEEGAGNSDQYEIEGSDLGDKPIEQPATPAPGKQPANPQKQPATIPQQKPKAQKPPEKNR
jgi:penicillin-binding protein 1A